jgi:hypothetical protein
MSHTFYKDNDFYIFATGKYPKGFAKVLYITWDGSLDNVRENVQPTDQLAALTKVKAKDVPDEWWNAFAEASKLFEVRDSDEQFEEFVAHCAAGTDPITAVVASGWELQQPSNPCVEVTQPYVDELKELEDAEEPEDPTSADWFALGCLAVSVILTLWIFA